MTPVQLFSVLSISSQFANARFTKDPKENKNAKITPIRPKKNNEIAYS